MLGRFSHTVLCVRDLDVSVAFYEKLGLNKFFEFSQSDPIAGEVVGLKTREVRMAFMRLGSAPETPFLDIVQFVDPPSQGKPYAALNNVGIGRVAFAVDDIDTVYEKLERMDVDFVTPLQRLITPHGDPLAMVCFRDPDGIFIEIISGLKVE
ncbi:MAG TPA: VOC family protein [Novosphingobium sp.]|nr:VOC family protein [Novosphingobium sp.]